MSTFTNNTGNSNQGNTKTKVVYENAAQVAEKALEYARKDVKVVLQTLEELGLEAPEGEVLQALTNVKTRVIVDSLRRVRENEARPVVAPTVEIPADLF